MERQKIKETKKRLDKIQRMLKKYRKIPDSNLKKLVKHRGAILNEIDAL